VNVIDTSVAGVGEGFGYFRDVLSRAPVTMEVRCPTPVEFWGRLRSVDLAGVTVASVETRSGSYEVARTRPFIERSDPESYRLVLNVNGTSEFLHHGRCVTLSPGDMALFDTSHPFSGRRTPGDDGTERLVMATFPHSALCLAPKQVRTLLGTRLPSMGCVSALVREFLKQIAGEPGVHRTAAARRMSAALLDLLVVHLANQLDETSEAVCQAGDSTDLLRVQAFVEERLGDVDLTPDAVATAHHMSLRTLQRLFTNNDLTVAGWIRSQRLERCRHDLLDPRLSTRSVRAIARRWGFADQTHFNRVFRKAYGMTPLACRRQTDHTPDAGGASRQ
jgi:AraC-like DNA-binding protein